MKFFFLTILFLLAILLEATIVQLPFVLVLLLIVTVVYQSEWVFFIAIFVGMILDTLLFRPLGSTEIFFLLFLLFVFLYDRKFELRTVQFAAMMSFLGSGIYFLLFGSSILWLQVILSVCIGVGCFFVFSLLHRSKPDASFALDR